LCQIAASLVVVGCLGVFVWVLVDETATRMGSASPSQIVSAITEIAARSGRRMLRVV
jgi:hypothetical protein